MIEYKHDKISDGTSLMIKGTVQEITAEVTMLISLVYGAIHEDSPISALEYRLALMHALQAKEMENVIWTETAAKAGTKISVDPDMAKILQGLVNEDEDDESE